MNKSKLICVTGVSDDETLTKRLEQVKDDYAQVEVRGFCCAALPNENKTDYVVCALLEVWE